jgi:hypothetical protein
MRTAARRWAVSSAGVSRSPGLRLSRDDSELRDGVDSAPLVRGASGAAREKLLSGACREVVAPASAVMGRCTRRLEGATRNSRACHEMGSK